MRGRAGRGLADAGRAGNDPGPGGSVARRRRANRADGWLAVGMLVAAAGCQGTAAAGAEEPGAPRTLADFHTISRANVHRASIQQLTGIDPVREWALLLWVERAHELSATAPHGAPLFLNGVTRLCVERARVLAQFEGDRIFLPDLAVLDAPTAAALAARGHELYLDGVRVLDLATCRALADSGARALSLGGLASLSPGQAAELARFPNGLRLHGLERLDVPTAAALAAWRGWGEAVLLSLGGLEHLEQPQARALAACRGWGLALDGLRELPPAVARELGALDTAYLSLDGLTAISPATARELARWKRKFLTLDGLRSIDAETRALVEAGSEAVSLRGLSR